MWTEAGSPDAAARHGRSFRHGRLSQLGVVVAGQPARALQPRFLQHGRKSVGSGSQADLVERSLGKVGWQRRAGLQTRLHPKDHMGPFIMNPEGIGRLFAPIGVLADGPFPEHYEPIESPIKNPLHPDQSNNPLVKKFNTPVRQVWIAGGVQHRLHHLSADRAVSLLDEK
jgi:hypothetical protein